MSIQRLFNEQCLSELYLVQGAIAKAGEFEANQMRCFATSAALNSIKPYDEMSAVERLNFQADLLEIFEHKG